MKNKRKRYLALAVIMAAAAVSDLAAGARASNGVLTFAGICFLIACVSFAAACIKASPKRDQPAEEGAET